jgi:hypothetical protein
MVVTEPKDPSPYTTFLAGQVLGRLTGTFLRQQLLNGTKP